VFHVLVSNQTSGPMNGFMISFNKNPYRLKPISTAIPIQQLNPGQSQECEVALSADSDAAGTASLIQIAVKNNVSVFYFAADCPLTTFFVGDSAMQKQQYLPLWVELEPTEQSSLLPISGPLPQVISTLQAHGVALIAQKNLAKDLLYLCARVVGPTGGADVVLVELTIQGSQCKCCTRTTAQWLVPLFHSAIAALLR